MRVPRHSTLLLTVASAFPHCLSAQDNSSLAQELANPIAAIYSFPLDFDYDQNLGASGEGTQKTLTFSPVVPFELDNGASIVTRTLVSYVWQDNVVPGTSESGLSDVLVSAWYSDVTESGLIWGVGPVVNIPTGSTFSTDTWALGPTAIALRVTGHWTYGILANHLWDIEKNPTTPINETFMWPWLSYTTSDNWTFSLSSETTYDWNSSEWSVPVDIVVSKLTQPGKVPINWQASIGYWATSRSLGPKGARFSLMAQIVLPRN